MRIRVGGVRETGEEREGCGSSKSAESGREMQNATCCHLYALQYIKKQEHK